MRRTAGRVPRRGLFLEGLHFVDAGVAFQLCAALDVAKAGGGMGGRNAEGEEVFRAGFNGLERLFSRAAWKTSIGSMIWSAVSTAKEASGSRFSSTAAGKPTALAVSRPMGSPRSCDSGSIGRFSRICLAYEEPVQM